MNIFYMDMEKYDYETCCRVFNQVKEVIDDDVIFLPTNTHLIMDASMEHLIRIRDEINKAIIAKMEDKNNVG